MSGLDYLRRSVASQRHAASQHQAAAKQRLLPLAVAKLLPAIAVAVGLLLAVVLMVVAVVLSLLMAAADVELKPSLVR